MTSLPNGVEDFAFNGKALIVDDVEIDRKIIASMAREAGLDVTTAKDGLEAVEKAAERPYDIIFMDIQMPSMNGIEAARELRKRGIKTPIIAVTAYTLDGYEKDCCEAGCNEFVPKPIGCAKLLELILRHVRQKASMGRGYKCNEQRPVAGESQNIQNCAIGSSGKTNPAETVPVNENAIDLAALIEAYGSEEFALEVVDYFAQEAPKLLNGLEEAIREKDNDKLVFCAHKLHGLARQVKMESLKKQAEDFENVCRDKGAAGIGSLFEELHEVFNKVLSSLLQSRQSSGKQL